MDSGRRPPPRFYRKVYNSCAREMFELLAEWKRRFTRRRTSHTALPTVKDVIVWNHEHFCLILLFVLVSWGFIRTFEATRDLKSEWKMGPFQWFRVSGGRGSWLCSHSSAPAGTHPGTTAPQNKLLWALKDRRPLSLSWPVC